MSISIGRRGDAESGVKLDPSRVPSLARARSCPRPSASASASVSDLRRPPKESFVRSLVRSVSPILRMTANLANFTTYSSHDIPPHVSESVRKSCVFPRPAAAREEHTTFSNPFSDIRYIATKCLGKKWAQSRLVLGSLP